MRRLLYILIAYCFSLISCTNVGLIEEEQVANDSDRIIMVGINLAGDIETDESPLSRAETDSRDLIGIQVKKNGSYFCFGLFDSMEAVQVALQAGAKYNFTCTVIKNGKDICFDHYCGDYAEKPFYRGRYTTSGSRQCDNTFHYSGYGYSNLADDYIIMSTYTLDQRFVSADRLYGELSDYTPTVNGTITIPMRRVSCGIKIKVLGVTDGTAKVKCYSEYDFSADIYENPAISGSVETEGTMYCMANVKDAWQYADDDYQEPIKMSVVWTRGNGIVQDLGTKTVYVKRNVMNTIKIKLSTNDSDVDVDTDPEKGGMDEDDEDLSN